MTLTLDSAAAHLATRMYVRRQAADAREKLALDLPKVDFAALASNPVALAGIGAGAGGLYGAMLDREDRRRNRGRQSRNRALTGALAGAAGLGGLGYVNREVGNPLGRFLGRAGDSSDLFRSPSDAVEQAQRVLQDATADVGLGTFDKAHKWVVRPVGVAALGSTAYGTGMGLREARLTDPVFIGRRMSADSLKGRKIPSVIARLKHRWSTRSPHNPLGSPLDPGTFASQRLDRALKLDSSRRSQLKHLLQTSPEGRNALNRFFQNSPDLADAFKDPAKLDRILREAQRSPTGRERLRRMVRHLAEKDGLSLNKVFTRNPRITAEARRLVGLGIPKDKAYRMMRSKYTALPGLAWLALEGALKGTDYFTR